MLSFGAGFFTVAGVTGFFAAAVLTGGTVAGAIVACGGVAAGVFVGEAALAPGGSWTDPVAVAAVVAPDGAGVVFAAPPAGVAGDAAVADDDAADAACAAGAPCAHGFSPCAVGWAAGWAAADFLCPKIPFRLATAVVAVATADVAWSLARWTPAEPVAPAIAAAVPPAPLLQGAGEPAPAPAPGARPARNVGVDDTPLASLS